MKAVEQCFPVVLFFMLFKAVVKLLFKSVNEILYCEGLNKKSFSAVIFCHPVCFAIICRNIKLEFGTDSLVSSY